MCVCVQHHGKVSLMIIGTHDGDIDLKQHINVLMAGFNQAVSVKIINRECVQY